MKKFIGLIILLIACVAFSACTQQAAQETVTTVPTTVPTTVVTIVPTTEITLAPTGLATTVATTALPVATRTLSPSTKVVTIIHIRNNSFVPQQLTVLPGTGISWVNDDDKIHAVKTIGTYAGKFNSGDILPGAVWSYTFGKLEGNFEFTDSYHSEMKGTIIIRKADTSIIDTPALSATVSP